MTKPVGFTVPEGSVGMIGSPGEFARIIRDGHALPTTRTVQIDEYTELRMFTLPEGTPPFERKKIPGYNIRIVQAGDVLTSEEATDA